MWVSLILMASCLILSYPRARQFVIVKRWRKALALDKHEHVFSNLYEEVDGFALSREARASRDAIEYVYGEIDFISFIALLSLARPDSNTVFYDLGSGTGKAVLACAMVFNVQKCYGVELFDSLHHAAGKQQRALCALPDYANLAKTIHFINDNFFHANLDNSTMVFINATGFFGLSWIELSQRLEQTPSCTIVITTSKTLKSSAFAVTKTTSIQMSWGIARAYIHERKKIG